MGDGVSVGVAVAVGTGAGVTLEAGEPSTWPTWSDAGSCDKGQHQAHRVRCRTGASDRAQQVAVLAT